MSTVIVSFKAPAELVAQLDELVREGVFTSRSEALRRALVLLVTRYRVPSSHGKAVQR